MKKLNRFKFYLLAAGIAATVTGFSPIDTKAETAAAETTAAAPVVSDKLFDNQFSINGTVYTLPLGVKDLQGAGFSLPAEKASNTLAPKTLTSGRLETSAGASISVSFYNLGSDAISLGDAKISMINFYQKYLKDVKVSFSKGITLGASVADVKAAYGEPSKYYSAQAAGKAIEKLTYRNGDTTNRYEFAFEDNVLVEVDMGVQEK